jgi:hypothetical protein
VPKIFFARDKAQLAECYAISILAFAADDAKKVQLLGNYRSLFRLKPYADRFGDAFGKLILCAP